jgi:hypothetical protein
MDFNLETTISTDTIILLSMAIAVAGILIVVASLMARKLG